MLADRGEIGERSRALLPLLFPPPPPLATTELLLAMLDRCMAIVLFAIQIGARVSDHTYTLLTGL